MFGLGPMEVIVLLALGGGGQTGELAAFLPADIYFQSRNIETKIDTLVALASKEPADGKTQIAQLLALRMLAERADEVKKAENYKDLVKKIERIAKGEIAKDAHGFSRAHANHTLTALGGTGKPSEAKPSDLRKDTLNWFPASATLVGAFDFSGQEASAEQGRELRKFWSKVLKPRDWDGVFAVAEQIGNVRVDRLGFAFHEGKKRSDPLSSDGGEIFVRISGRASHERLVKAFNAAVPPPPRPGKRNYVASEKEPGGLMVSTFKGLPGLPFQLCLIGDSDFFFAVSHDEKEPFGKIFAVRAGKHDSVLQGVLKDSLAKVSKKASGLMVGDVPKGMRDGLAREFGVAPKSIRSEILREKLGIDIKFEGTFANADEAKTFTAKAFELRKMALNGIDKMPKDLPLPAAAIAAVKRTIQSIQIQADGAAVKGGVLVPSELLRTLPSWLIATGL
jgi:hypothetical protein